MLRIIFSVSLLIVCVGKAMAQDTIVLHGQPNWKKSLDIANQSFFYEEQAGKNMSFDEIKKQAFLPYRSELRKQKLSNRPLIIQWYKFTISNTSLTDTIQLRFTPSPHYFTRLYSSSGLLNIGGVYETRVSAFERPGLPFKVAPLSIVTFWARMEDRQNQLVTPGIELDTPLTFAEKMASGRYIDRYLYLMLALLAGCLVFISVYAIFQYYLYRDNAFIWYTAYTIGSLITCFFWMDIRMSLALFPAIVHDLMLSVFLFAVPVLYSLFIGSICSCLFVLKEAGW